ncbi:MAG TPA: class A beta-lactamase [Chryseolinea sp.]|nr:class A beta-lactamase [Chryseolinea sp.]HPM28761.1 class A beta-lactamase [Chryseolinea sp.]
MILIKKSLLILLLTSSSIFVFGQNSLETQFGLIAKKIDGNVGVSAMVLETGESASYSENKKFPMQSLYKFPLAMAVLHQVDEGKLSIDQKIPIEKSEIIPNSRGSVNDKILAGIDLTLKELIWYTVGESDNTACDVLFRAIGGTTYANNYVHKIGVSDIVIATTERIQMQDDSIQYQNWATPQAMTQLLKILCSTNTLSEKSRSLLLEDMVQSLPGQKRIKGLLPSGTVVAHKTGTAATINGLTRATNDSGIITLPNGKHLAITVFISDSHASHAERELTIATISKAAFDYWSAVGK